MPVSRHSQTWHKPVVTNNFNSDLTVCKACDGFGYAHQQKLFMENGKMISEVEREKDCLKCKGSGYILKK